MRPTHPEQEEWRAETLTCSIIGGGIGGLTAALALRKVGHHVTISEQQTQPEAGAGLMLTPNATAVLVRLGLGGELAAIGQPTDTLRMLDASGAQLAQVSLREMADLAGAPAVFVQRADLREILHRALAGQDPHSGARLVSIRPEPDAVEAVFSDGQVQHSDVLVGADGIHSTLRTLLQGHRPLRARGTQVFRAITPPFRSAHLRPGEACEVHGPGLLFGAGYTHGEQIYFWAMVAQADPLPAHKPIRGAKALLLSRFGRFCSPVPEIIESTPEESLLCNPSEDLPPQRVWGRGRITRLGDAAHPMTPHLGQGACMAIEDALVLSRHLDRTLSVVTAMRRYEAERRSRTAWVQRISSLLSDVACWRGPLALLVRRCLYRGARGRANLKFLRWLYQPPAGPGR